MKIVKKPIGLRIVPEEKPFYEIVKELFAPPYFSMLLGDEEDKQKKSEKEIVNEGQQ